MKKFPILFSLLLMISGCATQLPDETESTKEKIEKLEKQAESGDDKALEHLGSIYRFGEGVKQDFAKAHSYYKKAVEKGSGAAAHHLGSMYSKGEGVEKSTVEAKKWHKKSVELDPSDFNRCVNGLHKNQAFSSLLMVAILHKESADKASALAQSSLAAIYSNGIDFVPANPKEAMRWYIIAAESNDLQACRHLSKTYRDGSKLLGIEKNQEEAEKWRKKAEDLGVEKLYIINLKN